MNDLDTRGRQAAAAIRQAVRETPVGVTRVKRSRALPAFAGGALAAIASMAVAAVITPPEPTSVDQPVTTVIVTTTTLPPASTTTVSPTTVTSAPAVAGVETTVAVDTEPPMIEIISPDDGFETTEERIEFRGITEPGARVFAGPYEADVTAGGEWSIVLILSEGENPARFVAVDKAGNESEAWVTVVLESPEETAKPPETTVPTEPDKTTTTTVVEVEFSAHASFGICSETPPYDVYYGTGTPGMVVEAGSEYGSGRTEVRSDGTWEMKVVFAEAPLGKAFTVNIGTSKGHSKSFSFEYVGE